LPLTFENPPLVELIAELRWSPLPQGASQTVEPGNIAASFITANTSPLEEFFMRFGGAVQQLGFTGIERLIPAAFPMVTFQPVFRFRPPKTDTAVLYQVGAGIFSANAIPPYKTWKKFAPVVEQGVVTLLSTRSEAERETPFTGASLRYIDAFASKHAKGLEIAEFVQQVLRIGVSLPVALTKRIAAGRKHKIFLQLQLPMLDGMIMSIGIGEGIANKQTSILMDTTVATTTPIPPTKQAVMDCMNTAHDAIHDMFVEITEPIRDLMQPIDLP